MDEISTEDYLAMPETMARQSLDLGFAYAPAFEEAFTYVGLNFYLRPVNKQAPLRGLQFKRRFALMFGTTLTGSVLKDNERFGLFGDRMVVAGAGFRFLDSLRLVAGTLLFKQDDPKPLVIKKIWAWAPFVSVSIDWNVKDMFVKATGASVPQ